MTTLLLLKQKHKVTKEKPYALPARATKITWESDEPVEIQSSNNASSWTTVSTQQTGEKSVNYKFVRALGDGEIFITADVGSASSGESPIKIVNVTLNHAQILTIPTTPVEIIPAPGPNKINRVILAHMKTDMLGGSYGNIEAETLLTLRHDSPNLRPVGIGPKATVLIDDGAINLTPFSVDDIWELPEWFTLEQFVNTPILLYAYQENDFTGGHADNTLKVTVVYMTLDV